MCQIIRPLFNISLLIVHRFVSKVLFACKKVSIISRSKLRSLCFKGVFYKCGNKFSPGAGFSAISPDYISLGSGFVTGKNVRLHAWPVYAGVLNAAPGSTLIKIGSSVFINDSSYITAAFGISIGDHCLIGSNVLITDNSHGDISFDATPRINQPLTSKGKVSVGNNVWICNNVVITSGVNIGKNSIVAANSVVTKSFPPSSLIAGVPARLIKSLNIY